MKTKIQEVADALLGTCKNADDVISEIYGAGTTLCDLSMGDCEKLDAITMECSICGWWTEADDVDDDQVCSECADGEGERVTH